MAEYAWADLTSFEIFLICLTLGLTFAVGYLLSVIERLAEKIEEMKRKQQEGDG